MLAKISLAMALLGVVGVVATTEGEQKNIAIFNVVNFPNDVCESDSSRNGTCYTSSECSSRGGASSGSCAEGFGVCCVFKLSCGDSSSDNNTYLVQSSFTTGVDSPCLYSICKMNSNICRIRFDFTTNSLATTPSVAATAVGTANDNPNGSAMGHCVTDSMTVSSGGTSAPVICGYNTGQHMIIDAMDTCSEIKFQISSSTSTTREWDIFVSQYECGQVADNNGPPGCLQYYTADTDTISSFGFPASDTVGATIQHLANQYYTACIRRNSNKCGICYTPIFTTPAATSITGMGTFGLSVSDTAATTKGLVGSNCATDYVYIPGGAASPGTLDAASPNRFCGRYFASATGTAHATVCTLQAPFVLGVNFDSTEVTTGTAANMATTMEANGTPSGTIGFRLVYTQQNC